MTEGYTSDEIDSIITNFEDFIPYSSEEEEFRIKLKALLEFYNFNKDRGELSHKFNEIFSQLQATKELEPSGVLEFIDADETIDDKDKLYDYEKHLETIKPNRPMRLLIIIAHLSSKIPGEEKSNYIL